MNWDEYGISLAQVAALKSKDPWQKVGAAILREDNTTLSPLFTCKDHPQRSASIKCFNRNWMFIAK